MSKKKLYQFPMGKVKAIGIIFRIAKKQKYQFPMGKVKNKI